MAKAVPRLGVNIDHVATLRQQREEMYPSLERAALLALKAGAEQITMHLREDRRHVQDRDMAQIYSLIQTEKKLFNFELGANEDIVAIALALKPHWICLVPEKREEKTTEGGLDLNDPNNVKRLSEVIKKFRVQSPKTKISLFLEADPIILTTALSLEVDAVEIHTGSYAHDFHRQFSGDYNLSQYLDRYARAYDLIGDYLGFHAGHGLSNESLVPLLKQGLFQEYNIGHWIIADSIFSGISNSVAWLNKLMKQYPIDSH